MSSFPHKVPTEAASDEAVMQSPGSARSVSPADTLSESAGLDTLELSDDSIEVPPLPDADRCKDWRRRRGWEEEDDLSDGSDAANSESQRGGYEEAPGDDDENNEDAEVVFRTDLGSDGRTQVQNVLVGRNATRMSTDGENSATPPIVDLPESFDEELSRATLRVERDNSRSPFVSSMMTSRTVLIPSEASRPYDRFLPTESPAFPTGMWKDEQLDSLLAKCNAKTSDADDEGGKSDEGGSVIGSGGGSIGGLSNGDGDAKKKKKKKKNGKKKKKAKGSIDELGRSLETGDRVGTPVLDSEASTAALAAEPGAIHPLPTRTAKMTEIVDIELGRLPVAATLKDEEIRWGDEDIGSEISETTATKSNEKGTDKLRWGDDDEGPSTLLPNKPSERRLQQQPQLQPQQRIPELKPQKQQPAQTPKQPSAPQQNRKNVDRMDSKMDLNQARLDQDAAEALHSGYQTLVFSSHLSPRLFGGLLEEVVKKLDWKIEGITRRSDMFHLDPTQQPPRGGYSIKPVDDWRLDLDRATRGSLSLVLRRKATSTPLTRMRGLGAIHSYLKRTVASPGFAYSQREREAVEDVTLDELVYVMPSKGDGFISPDGQDRRLPPRQKAEDRIARTTSFYTNPELPQIVFFAARLDFAVPIIKRLTEPLVGRSSSKTGPLCELVGIKYLDELLPYQAEVIVPFAEEGKRNSAIQAMLQKNEKEEGGWVLAVVRKVNGFEEVGRVIDSYLSSYQSISSAAETPHLGRKKQPQRRRESTIPAVKSDDTSGPSESAVLTESELLHLNVVVAKDVRACYQLVTLFFKDAELIAGDPRLWEDCEYHPPEYLANPYLTKTMLGPPPFLATVCIMKSALFPHLGKLLSLIVREGFTISALKMSRIIPSTARKLLGSDATIGITKDLRDEFARDVAAGASIILVLQRENGIKKFRSVLDELHARSLTPSGNAGNAKQTLMRGGLYGSTTHRLAALQKQLLFPENVTIHARAVPWEGRFIKTLLPLTVTEIPMYPRKVYVMGGGLARRDSVSSASSSCAASRSSTPPPTPTGAPPASILGSIGSGSGAVEVACLLFLPLRETVDENVEMWRTVLDTCLMADGPKVVNGGEKSGEQQDCMKLVGCKYVILGDTILEWIKESLAVGGDRDRELEVCHAIRNGPCLVAAFEQLNCNENLQSTLQR
ncbi:hypothetical protein HK104_008969 [Borealophlyctis nickersoniae]|nr:hypothetical protein HK104_008969 [Borealophlyctis nickersoniae]